MSQKKTTEEKQILPEIGWNDMTSTQQAIVLAGQGATIPTPDGLHSVDQVADWLNQIVAGKTGQ